MEGEVDGEANLAEALAHTFRDGLRCRKERRFIIIQASYWLKSNSVNSMALVRISTKRDVKYVTSTG